MTMDGVTIDDTTNGGVIKLEISEFSAGTALTLIRLLNGRQVTFV